MNYDEYLKSVKMLNLWAKAYYSDDAPLVSDAVYDELYHKVLDFEKNNPLLVEPSSPTRRIGDAISEGFSKSEHLAKMWSMEDIFNETELKEWLERNFKQSLSMYIEPKFDGASLNLLYENGKLIKAATRGDGAVGEDVTNNALVIAGIPHEISYKGLIEIRGEVVITKADFEKINAELLANGAKPLANPRNAAAGSLRQLDSAVARSRHLRFYPWDAGQNSLKDDFGYNTHKEIMDFIRSLGFLRDDFCVVCTGFDEIMKAYKKLLALRESKEMLMDGMVVRTNELKYEAAMGYTVKFPRFMVAFKFPALELSTTLLGISWQVGRTGAITPVGLLKSVNIDGAMVSNATLHNADEIARLNLSIGDVVKIVRSGDVIPKITGIFEKKSNEKIKPPSSCPCCGGELFSDGAILKCQNLECKARVLNSLIYFASKKCMNIDGLGTAIITLLYELGKIKNIIDIYRLEAQDFATLEGFKDKKIANILNSIEASKTPTLARFIASLGIELIGEVAAKKIAQKFGDKWLELDYDELLALDGFGENMAKSYLEFMRVNVLKVRELLSFITPIIDEKKLENSALENKSVVITGTLNAPREAIKERLERLGAKVTSSISAKTDFLLCGQNAGSKLEKAQQLGVKIVDISWLESLENSENSSSENSSPKNSDLFSESLF